jgi:hypothetical protein
MLRMSKRLATWLLSPLLALSMAAACGGTSESDGTGGASTGGVGGAGGAGGTGGAGGSGGTTTDGGEYLKCFDANGKFTAYQLKMCGGSQSCAIMVHQTDCCGNTLLMGVDAARLAELQACETAWRATLPDCQCAAGPPQIEQPAGTTVNDASEAELGCINWTSSGGICMTQPKE